MTYQEATKRVKRPVACIGYHDPKTMTPRIASRDFWRDQKLKTSQGIASCDRTRWRRRREMRSFVPGQCPVEYYCLQRAGEAAGVPTTGRGPEGREHVRLRGSEAHVDFKHKETGAPVLKAQRRSLSSTARRFMRVQAWPATDCHTCPRSARAV
ncbi:MAG: ammonia-forming cytochrome c nitrite reductase subunit c552 [Bryobacterales bacterium]|nr:ammonia-forming cytochrome c nitrite reductase subunit c552 [Bryobacterales bacterium]